MTYFRMGNPHYHRRAAVSRSCSGWEGVVPAGYGRQALVWDQASGRAESRERPAPEPAEEVKVVRLMALPTTTLRFRSRLREDSEFRVWLIAAP